MTQTTSEQVTLKQQTGISIHPLVRPAPDVELLAQAFIRITEEQRTVIDQDLDQAA